MKRDISFERIVSVDSSIAFEAVRNFDEYADFIPTCTKASLISSKPPIEVGQLEFNILGKNYFIQSENTVSNDSVKIKQLEGPFDSFEGNRANGNFILIDSQTNETLAAGMIK